MIFDNFYTESHVRVLTGSTICTQSASRYKMAPNAWSLCSLVVLCGVYNNNTFQGTWPWSVLSLGPAVSLRNLVWRLASLLPERGSYVSRVWGSGFVQKGRGAFFLVWKASAKSSVGGESSGLRLSV